MNQGDIWWSDLSPAIGSEQNGRRPVLIISGNLLNKYLKVVIVAPLSTKIKNYKGNPVIIPDPKNKLTEPSEVMVFHLRSVSKERLFEKIGEVDQKVISEIRGTINDLLTL